MSKGNQPTRGPVPAQVPGPTDPDLAAALREEAEDADSDERVVRSSGDRGDRGVKEDAERAAFDGLMSDEEYEALVRNEFEQTALPTPPAIPGWHLCWLTTTSQYDSIQKRQRIGYKPVRLDELPGFDPSNGQSLERFAGYVTCNEMVLHKIPEVYYQRMMTYFHHKRPLEDQQQTLQKIKDGNSQEQDSSGRDLGEILGTGLLDMERTAKRATQLVPRFRS